MHILHKIIDIIFSRFPAVQEFCFLALPLAHSKDVRGYHYNDALWNSYLDQHPDAIRKMHGLFDAQSIRWVKRLINRRKSRRYFLTLSEIIRYYKAKRLQIPYWFPDNGTLLKSVFVTRAGTVYLPTKGLKVLKNRIAIDGGPASGDSSIALLDAGVGHVMAFEPSPRQQSEMREVFSRNHLAEQIDIIPFALDETRQQITFNDQYGEAFTAESVSIDEYCKSKDVGCIKLDIEGAEFPTIRGAAQTIERCRPVLIVCVYHRPEDLFEMPLWLHEHFPFYKFCIRETEPETRAVGAHLVLVAWPS